MADTTQQISISGMSCASCVGRVEGALRAVPGVSQADVNLASASAVVTARSPRDIAAAIQAATDLGYPAQLRDEVRRAEDEADASDEIDRLRKRVLLAALLTLPVFLIEMGGHIFPPIHHWVMATIGQQTSFLLQFVLTTLVMAIPGRDFYRKGVPALLHARPDMNALVALGSGAAWAYSVVATFAPQVLPEGSVAVYYEAAAVIVTLILVGRWLEARAKGRTGAAIARLVGLQPNTALIVKDGAEVEVPIDALRVGDVLRIKPGARIATDAVVTEGQSWIDEAMLTGEPDQVRKAAGDAVTGGTVNGAGALDARVTQVGADTVLQQIIAMVEAAQGARLPIQELVNKITGWFVPAVLAVAAVTVALWLIFGPDPALGRALVAGVSVLIIACPCAMGLATPVSIMVGTGRAADMGVLFRKGDALQGLAGVSHVAFDKTGTLTEGKPALADTWLADGVGADHALGLVAALEQRSEHPIAAALIRAAGERGVAVPEAQYFDAIPGMGIAGEIEGKRVLAGAPRLMVRDGIAMPEAATPLPGHTPVYLAVDGTLVARFGVADRVKPSAVSALAALKAQGLRLVMLTGDAQGTADAIAQSLGIDEVHAELMPDDKLRVLAGLQDSGAAVAFVGDGINDAPALAQADVGLAVGTGTDVAMEAADVVLMSGDLGAVPRAFAVSHATLRNIRQNLFWAFGYNVALIPVAAGVLYLFGGPLLSPALAAGAMALSSVFVISNALRLRRVGADLGTTGGGSGGTTPARHLAEASA